MKHHHNHSSGWSKIFSFPLVKNIQYFCLFWRMLNSFFSILIVVIILTCLEFYYEVLKNQLWGCVCPDLWGLLQVCLSQYCDRRMGLFSVFFTCPCSWSRKDLSTIAWTWCTFTWLCHSLHLTFQQSHRNPSFFHRHHLCLSIAATRLGSPQASCCAFLKQNQINFCILRCLLCDDSPALNILFISVFKKHNLWHTDSGCVS